MFFILIFFKSAKIIIVKRRLTIMIKVDVISGFLGAGKTTLIKKLFESKFKGEKVVIIENEFGDINIDTNFLKDSGVKIKEINAGCICCSLVGDFEASIKELINTYSPNRIIIEPSGVGKLSDIVNAIEKVKGFDLHLNILATMVDGKKAKMHLKNFGEFFLNQIQNAKSIIITKMDKLTENQQEEVLHIIRENNPHANIITTSIFDLDSSKLLETLEQDASLQQIMIQSLIDDEHECCHHHHDEDEEHECCHHHHDEDEEHECCHHHHDEDEEHECCHHHHDEDEEHECCHHHHDEDEEHECCHHHHHHGHDADEVFASWGKETLKSISYEKLDNFLKSLQDENLGIIVRATGYLKASDNDKWYYFDYVYGDYQIRLDEPTTIGRVVVIGSHINEEKIANLFEN